MASQARQRRSAPHASPEESAALESTAAQRGRASDAVAGDRQGQLRQFYRDMVLVRRFEERAARAYTEALIGGYCHLNLGEEAAVVGLMSALRPTDYLYTNYREHGYAIMRGIDPKRVMAELYGRVDGVSKGWGGSMHMLDADAIAAIDEEVARVVNAAADFAANSPHPEVSTLFDYTYATPVPNDSRRLPGEPLFPPLPLPGDTAGVSAGVPVSGVTA